MEAVKKIATLYLFSSFLNYWIPFSSRSLVANLAAANNFKKSHIELSENKQIIENAKYIYVGVSTRRFLGVIRLRQYSCIFLLPLRFSEILEALSYVLSCLNVLCFNLLF